MARDATTRTDSPRGMTRALGAIGAMAMGTVLTLSGPALGQPVGGEPARRQPQAERQPQAARQPMGDLSPAEVQRLFDAYTLVQAQEMLQLDDERYGQFVSRMKALQDARRRAQVGRQRIIGELVRLSNQQDSAVDDQLISTRLDELDAHDAQSTAEIREVFEQVDGLLDLRQRARFRAFEQQMERRKLDLLMRAGQSARRPR